MTKKTVIEELAETKAMRDAMLAKKGYDPEQMDIIRKMPVEIVKFHLKTGGIVSSS